MMMKMQILKRRLSKYRIRKRRKKKKRRKPSRKRNGNCSINRNRFGLVIPTRSQKRNIQHFTNRSRTTGRITWRLSTSQWRDSWNLADCCLSQNEHHLICLRAEERRRTISSCSFGGCLSWTTARNYVQSGYRL